MNRNLLIGIHFTNIDNQLFDKLITTNCMIILDKPKEFLSNSEVQRIIKASIEHIKNNYQMFKRYKTHIVITMNYAYRPEEVYTTACPISTMNNLHKSITLLVKNLQDFVLENYTPIEIPEDMIPKEEIPIIPVHEKPKTNVKKFNL